MDLAQAMEEGKRYLSASLLYRALLDSILKRVYTKSYHHGVRYLKKLDDFAPLVIDWYGFADHQSYKRDIRSVHGRKRSFWGEVR